MGAGQLNKRAIFEREVRTPDGGGGFAVKWTPELTRWASYAPERGRERLQAARLESSASGILKVRCDSGTLGITAAHRVLVDGRTHQIRSISNPDQRHKYLEMIVEVGVAT